MAFLHATQCQTSSDFNHRLSSICSNLPPLSQQEGRNKEESREFHHRTAPPLLDGPPGALFVVGFAAGNLEGAVNLLQQNDARQVMRQRDGAKR